MWITLLFLFLSLLLLIKSADFAITYSTRLAESFRLPKYVIGFLVVAVISVLPETFISITSATEAIPEFALGVLFGSNVADLTLVFALVILVAGRSLRVESKILHHRSLHIAAILSPLVLGLNGYYSRLEGVLLIAIGVVFYWYILKNKQYDTKLERKRFSWFNPLFLIFSMAGLLAGAHFTIDSATALAETLQVNPILIGMFVVGLGTTLPELIFSIKAARSREDGLALGDILGTVVADATIVVGLIALIQPFAFPVRLTYVTGGFMAMAITLLFFYMKSGKKITRAEAVLLIVFYGLFVLIESWLARY